MSAWLRRMPVGVGDTSLHCGTRRLSRMWTIEKGVQMQKLIKAAIFLMFLAAVAQAQETPAADISVGYSNIWVGNSNTTASGGSGSVAFNVNHWLGAVGGDFGLYHSSVVGPDWRPEAMRLVRVFPIPIGASSRHLRRSYLVDSATQTTD